MGISTSGSRPLNLIISLAISAILTGSPMSRTECFAAAARGRRLQHEQDGFRNGHEIAFHLGVGDAPAPGLDLFLEKRDHASRLPITLPNLTEMNFVDLLRLKIRNSSSDVRFVAPMILVGLMALSVEIIDENLDAPFEGAFRQDHRAFDIRLDGFFGIMFHDGDVFISAAWRTTSGRCKLKVFSISPGLGRLAINGDDFCARGIWNLFGQMEKLGLIVSPQAPVWSGRIEEPC